MRKILTVGQTLLLLATLGFSNKAVGQTKSGEIVFKDGTTQRFESVIQIFGTADKENKFINTPNTLYYYYQKQFLPFSITNLKELEVKSFLAEGNLMRDSDILITFNDGRIFKSYYYVLEKIKVFAFDELTGSRKFIDIYFASGSRVRKLIFN